MTMSFPLAYRLALVTAVFYGVVESISVYSFVRSYLDAYHEIAASGIVVENWSLFVVEFLLNIACFVLSIIGFIGGVFGPRKHRRMCVFIFAFGFICTFVLRWLAVSLGVLHFYGVLSLVPSLLWFTWFGLLSVALWPNYSLKRTAAGRLR